MHPQEQITSCAGQRNQRQRGSSAQYTSADFAYCTGSIQGFLAFALQQQKNKIQTRKGMYERNETRVATIQAARSIKRSRIVLGISKRACSEGGLFEQA
jgi:tRNA 2-selenouridine synthase SelU